MASLSSRLPEEEEYRVARDRLARWRLASTLRADERDRSFHCTPCCPGERA
jgi:hypothetical protein